MTLSFSSYQEKAKQTVVFSGYGELEGIVYSALEVNDEAGEVAGKIKKVLRDEDGNLTEAKAEQIAAEMGDVLYALATLSDQLGFDLEDIAKANVEKLRDRAQRNQIKGDGDDR